MESKNGAVIRKHIGFGPIASDHAALVDQFHREFLNPYVNFHRPCGVPEEIVAANGKSKRVYPRYRTPYEILRQLPQAETFLRPGLDWAELDRQAMLQSDTEAARDMQEAKRDLFTKIRKRSA